MRASKSIVDLLIPNEDGGFDSKKVCLIAISGKSAGIVDYTGLIVDNMKVYKVQHDSIINYWLIDGNSLFDIATLAD